MFIQYRILSEIFANIFVLNFYILHFPSTFCPYLFILEGQSITEEHRHTLSYQMEYLERTYAYRRRTCKLQSERPQAGTHTQDLLAASLQC